MSKLDPIEPSVNIDCTLFYFAARGEVRISDGPSGLSVTRVFEEFASSPQQSFETQIFRPGTVLAALKGGV